MAVLVYDLDRLPDTFDPPWEPLDRVLRATRLDRRTDLRAGRADFMYMWRLVGDGLPPLHLYKHCDTRRYLNLDDDGRAYEFVGIDGERSLYRRHRSLKRAVADLQLELFARIEPDDPIGTGLDNVVPLRPRRSGPG